MVSAEADGVVQGLHSQILMMGGEWVRQRFIFYTQKNHNFRICLPKKITTFFSIPKKIPWSFFATPKNSSVCYSSQPQKILVSFIDPKKSLLPKFQTQKNHSDLPVTNICEWGPWVVCLSSPLYQCFVLRVQ